MSRPESPAGVRLRASKKKASSVPGTGYSEEEDLIKKTTAVLSASPAKQSQLGYKIALFILTIGALVTRFWKINHPNEVVFDEVHFGKFASYYLERTYFFDVHPPFGKLLIALVGWFVGYDGHFKFENIGDSYIDNHVPYVAFRAVPAFQGAMTVPVVFLIMWESGYSLPAAISAAMLMLFDNAHIGQTRLILLDATLILSMALSILCYVRFSKLRNSPFSRKWWKWLLLTGVSLSCVISTKYVGVFTFLTIGAAVAIDLWNLLDYRKGLSIQEFGKHFVARAVGLIVVPLFFYLFWFQVHFTVLNRSGPGDDFMTPAFQETLADNVMTQNSIGVHFYDTIQIRHKDTKSFLHSHPDKYPLRYEDGRVSSQGQQVTGYPFNDTNNHWVIVPATPFPEDQKLGHPIKNGALVKFHHVVTDSFLLSHDVASPQFPTNQEFTTVNPELANGARHNDTLFEIKIENAKSKTELRTLSTLIKIIHNPSKVAMWTHTKPLPDWAFKQLEINGNKNVAQSSNLWFIEDIPSLTPGDKRSNTAPKQIKSMPFISKYLELQRAMFHHNNALTSSHPYASQPIQWPFLLRGVSFWTKNASKQQIYFLGNPVGWWLTSSLLAVLAGIVGADQLTQRRGVDALDRKTRSKLYNSTGFFFLAWAAHYLPFFLMGRQLFLHHYLPAHLASTMVTGALVEFVFCSDPTHEEVVDKDGKKHIKSSQSYVAAWLATLVITGITIGGFVFFAPLTYGTPGLDVAQVNARKWLGYELHFAK